MKDANPRAGSEHSVVVVGLGNIGSHVIPAISRLPGLQQVTLVDMDSYEPANLVSQAIQPGDVGRAKVLVQARRLRHLNPHLHVRTLHSHVADVPLTLLQADVIVAGLDSLEARIHVNEIAWRLGVCWLDGGVAPDQQLVRVTGYVPGTDGPCLECSLDDGDYQGMGKRHLCSAGDRGVTSTNGSARLGALAASLLALECEKILADDREHALLGRQVVLDSVHHRHIVTSFRRNACCRFDHRVWITKPLSGLPARASVQELVDAVRHTLGTGIIPSSLDVPGRPLARALRCPRCGHTRQRLHLLAHATLLCPACGAAALRAAQSDLITDLTEVLAPKIRRKSIRSVGFCPGDIIATTVADAVHHLVIPKETL